MQVSPQFLDSKSARHLSVIMVSSLHPVSNNGSTGSCHHTSKLPPPQPHKFMGKLKAASHSDSDREGKELTDRQERERASFLSNKIIHYSYLPFGSLSKKNIKKILNIINRHFMNRHNLKVKLSLFSKSITIHSF